MRNVLVSKQAGLCTIVERVESFADLRPIGDAFIAGMAVFVEVAPDPVLLRRSVDFLTGLAYGTEATFERVDRLTYLVVPDLDWLDVHDEALIDTLGEIEPEPAVFESPVELLDFAAAV